MRKKRNFRKKKFPKEKVQGLQVKVYNNTLDSIKNFFSRILVITLISHGEIP